MKKLLFVATLLSAAICAPAFSQDAANQDSADSALTFQHYPRYYYNASRAPKFTLLFNSPVAPTRAGRELFFEDHDGKAVNATVRNSTADEIERFWKYYGSQDSTSPPAERFLTVSPSRLLPVGKNWKLVVPEGLRASDRQFQLKKRVNVGAGSVRPFTVTSSYAENPYNSEPTIGVSFSKAIEQTVASNLDRFIQLSPTPENLRIETFQRSVRLHGDFKYGQKYDLLVRAGLLATDDLELEEAYRSTVTFEPREGFITLPDYEVAQPISGEGKFKILAGNLESLRIRVKDLKGNALVYAKRGYAIYNPEKIDWEEGQKYPAFEMVPGKVIYDETITLKSELDHSDSYEINWSDILPEGTSAGLYLAVEGESRDHPNLKKHRVGASSIVQLTDLGIVWKKNRDQALVYAFSLKTGQAVPGAELQLFDSDNTELSTQTTNQDGVVSFPLTGSNAETTYLVASHGQDRYATDFDPSMKYGLSTWRFDINQKYWRTPDVRLRTFMFSDRGIYKPGDTVNLKAVTRMADGDRLARPNRGKSFDAKLTIYDSRGMVVSKRDVSFSERGSLDVSFPIPMGNVGSYRAQLDFDALLGKNPNDPEDDHYDRFASHYFTVADYRPNTFEVHVNGQGTYDGNEAIEIPVKANYYRGKPLSKAQMQWHASYFASTFRPSNFEAYTFGEENPNIRGHKAGEEELSPEGSSVAKLDFIPTGELEQPVRVQLGVDITDINQQTISQQSSFLVHSSDYYLGLKLPDGWLEAGNPIQLEMLPVTRDEQIYEGSVEAKLTIEREVWTTTKIKTAGGQIRHKNEWVYQPVSEQVVTVQKDANQTVTLPEGGTYRFTLETTGDESKIKTVTKRYIWGDGDVYWAHRDGDAIELVTDQESYVVGDTAKIMVRSPILGTALITTERAGVYRTFVRELSSKSQMIDLPITGTDAPNLFVSVLVIRGSQDSPHKYQDTDYKLGYCELKVSQPANALSVSFQQSQAEVLPGSQVEVVASIHDSSGQPVANAEVALYAVDRGVLSLTGYEIPDPGSVFHSPYPLSVKTWHTLFDVMTENPEERNYSNKGLMIGGGGSDLAMLRQNARKDFRATAFWEGTLLSDADGTVTASFTAPENLTEFKIFAVALGVDTDQYGSGSSKVTVNKPVVIEPALPAFANVGDQFLLQAVVHNTTNEDGRFEVTMTPDETIQFLETNFQIVPAAIEPVTTDGAWKAVIDLKAQSTEAIRLPVEFVETGEATWTWTIRDLNQNAKARTDSVETSLRVGYPVPLLRETHHVRLAPNSNGNLLASFGPDVMNGMGDIDVTISNTRMLEALDALEYNLQYPYGCVEQTTSSTLPWMTMNSLEKAFPSLTKDQEEKAEAINHGLNRLLSMQTHSGGLSYWPGAQEPMLWGSAWGGLALALGQQQGFDLPQERLDSLWSWLSGQLRTEKGQEGQGDSDYYYRCLGLYTLAIAGKAEPSYHEVYYEDRDKMKSDAKALLALAILEGGTAEQKPLVNELLKAEELESTMRWYGKGVALSTRLIALTKLDAQSTAVDETLNQLLSHRKPPYGWGSTYANAWPLLALANIADKEVIDSKPASMSLAWGDENPSIDLEGTFSSQNIRFGFEGDIRTRALNFENGNDAPLFANISVATRPEELSAEAKDRGFQIRRTYYKLAPDGALTESTHFEVGDLVVVDLETGIPNDNETYLAIDDPLPGVFEAINPAFENRANVDTPLNRWKQLRRDYEEIRTDRALFFSNEVWKKGTYSIQYLARVVASGNVSAPPAKIEAMYEPQRYGLSATTRITASLPTAKENQVAQK
tara:strand:+ start:33259 stop:38652 length:5394 start_codon:yes stop_codon:yes gene_type:complete